MDRIRITGGQRLSGRIPIGGSKNAALPLMAASLLTGETLSLADLPHLADIATMANLLGELGVTVEMNGDAPGGHLGRVFDLTAGEPVDKTAPYELVRRMRASVLVLGPLLARWGEARVSLPGGCAIGTRPVDLHLDGLRSLGAEIELEEGYIHARAPSGGLTGGHILFPSVSVGATENVLMAAVLAKGETQIANAAREPEVADLARCLVAMGAGIDGIGTDTLSIQGTSQLHGASYRVIPDRIEAGTYAVAAAITGGDLVLDGADFDTLDALADILGRCGAEIGKIDGGVQVRRGNGAMRGVDVMTEPFPGFPTDMQAQIMTLMAVSEGASMITESIFENRFMHVPELCRMGADINVHGASAIVRGVAKLSGAELMATDLRASVSLILAGLAAEGETIVNRVYHLDRGYERIEEKLSNCGADIERLQD